MGVLLSVIAGYIVGVVIAVLVEVGGTLVSENFFWSDYWRQSWIRLLIPLLSAATGLLIFLAVRDRDRGRFTGPATALGLVVVLGSFVVVLAADSFGPPSSFVPPTLPVDLEVHTQQPERDADRCSLTPFSALRKSEALVFDQDGVFLGGRASIGEGDWGRRGDIWACRFAFEIDLRRRADTYTIQIGDWAWEYTDADLIQDDFRLFLRLGD